MPLVRLKAKPKINPRRDGASENRNVTIKLENKTEPQNENRQDTSALQPENLGKVVKNEGGAVKQIQIISNTVIKDAHGAVGELNQSNQISTKQSSEPSGAISQVKDGNNIAEKLQKDEAELIVGKTQVGTANLGVGNVSIEYPPPPPSPSKINRDRIKAVPRFSELDESRQHGRIRNVSICSVASTTDGSENISSKDITPMIQKKVNRTEQSRKLAEAKKEFQKRFGAGNPDKQKLRMIDLIFFNPSTNPMKQTEKELDKNKPNEKINSEEKDGDDASQQTEEDPAVPDEDNSMPVPQIKIGPSGEIILDEQSLLIENEEIKKQKEHMQHSALVDGDFPSGYGIYKRAERSKDWSQRETLSFYKALNVIGTDFTLMAELFPKRTRRELKMKFKKEEKLNRHLIDKAVTQPCSYNYSELQLEFGILQKEEEELKKIKEEEAKARLDKRSEMKQNKKCFRCKEEHPYNKCAIKYKQFLPDPPVRDESSQDSLDLREQPKPRKTYKRRRVAKVPKQSYNSEEDSVEEESDESRVSDSDDSKGKKKIKLEHGDVSVSENAGSESEDETIAPILLPTRSGRIPKSTQKFEHEHLVVISTNAQRRRSPSVDSIKSDKAVPGSVMIVTEDAPDGNSVFKSFMVTPDGGLTSLELESAVISRVIDYKKSVEEESSGAIEECNLTIPADGDVTSLRSLPA
ncbi:uncharacterized protein LOC132700125 [Cylas formicarius]|uniref:uncharacterized protein LOC132700125 n=1 Tax=Cylas formicarius TaxID=197179 RepID=UPI002958517B|nr:uncharacterized protein LOC132700125 [Cylas formicarius]